MISVFIIILMRVFCFPDDVTHKTDPFLADEEDPAKANALVSINVPQF